MPNQQGIKILPIVSDKHRDHGNLIYLEINANLKTNGKLSLVEENGLYLLKIAGRSEQDLERGMMAFLRLLDKK